VDLFRKFLDLPQKARIGIALTVALVMFVLVWNLSRQAEEIEPTFMLVCWSESGLIRYVTSPDEATCENPQPLQWYDEPKLVYWGLDHDFDSFLTSHRMALEWWNDQLGRKHFIETSIRSQADIIIEQGDAILHAGGVMHTTHRRDIDGWIKATIRAVEFMDTRQWMLFEQHELGHAAFALAHDPSGKSIMREFIKEPDGQERWYLTDKDRKAILDSLEGK